MNWFPQIQQFNLCFSSFWFGNRQCKVFAVSQYQLPTRCNHMQSSYSWVHTEHVSAAGVVSARMKLNFRQWKHVKQHFFVPNEWSFLGNCSTSENSFPSANQSCRHFEHVPCREVCTKKVANWQPLSGIAHPLKCATLCYDPPALWPFQLRKLCIVTSIIFSWKQGLTIGWYVTLQSCRVSAGKP